MLLEDTIARIAKGSDFLDFLCYSSIFSFLEKIILPDAISYLLMIIFLLFCIKISRKDIEMHKYLEKLLTLYIIVIFWLSVYEEMDVHEQILLINDKVTINDLLLFRLGSLWSNAVGPWLLWMGILILYQLVLLHFVTPERTHVISSMIRSNSHRMLWILLPLLMYALYFYQILDIKYELDEIDKIKMALQNPDLVIHPPILFMGILGFFIIFSFIFTIIKDKIYPIYSFYLIKSFLFLHWGCLSLGIGLGFYWAYQEINWGGWWDWDPVEMLSLIPWLWSLLFLHHLHLHKCLSQSYLEFFYAFGGYILLIFNILLIRSNHLESVHKFIESGIYYDFLIILCVILHIYAIILFYSHFSGKVVSLKLNLQYITSWVSLFIYSLIFIIFIIYVHIASPMFFFILGLDDIIFDGTYYTAMTMPLCFMGLKKMHELLMKQMKFYYMTSPMHASKPIFLIPHGIPQGLQMVVSIYLMFMYDILSFFSLILLRKATLLLNELIWMLKLNRAFALSHLSIAVFTIFLILNKNYSFESAHTLTYGSITFTHFYEFTIRNFHLILNSYNLYLKFEFIINKNNEILDLIYLTERWDINTDITERLFIIYSHLLSDLFISLPLGSLDSIMTLHLVYSPFMIFLWFTIILSIFTPIFFFSSFYHNPLPLSYNSSPLVTSVCASPSKETHP